MGGCCIRAGAGFDAVRGGEEVRVVGHGYMGVRTVARGRAFAAPDHYMRVSGIEERAEYEYSRLMSCDLHLRADAIVISCWYRM